MFGIKLKLMKNWMQICGSQDIEHKYRSFEGHLRSQKGHIESRMYVITLECFKHIGPCAQKI